MFFDLPFGRMIYYYDTVALSRLFRLLRVTHDALKALEKTGMNWIWPPHELSGGHENHEIPWRSR